MSVYVRAHNFPAPNTCRIHLPLFQSLPPKSLAAAVLPMQGQQDVLPGLDSSTILVVVIGCNRDKLNSIPIARTYTTEFCRQFVHRLHACHKDETIDFSVAFRSEFNNESRRHQLQIPILEDGKKVDNSNIDDWFFINERTKRGSVHIYLPYGLTK